MKKYNNSIINKYYQGEDLLKDAILRNKSFINNLHIMYTLESMSVIEDVLTMEDMEDLEYGTYSFYQKDIKRKVLENNNTSNHFIEHIDVGRYSKQVRAGALRRSFHGLSPTDENVGIDPIYDRYDLLVIVDPMSEIETYIEYKVLDKMVSDELCDIYIKSISGSYEEFENYGELDYENIDIILEYSENSCFMNKQYLNKVYNHLLNQLKVKCNIYINKKLNKEDFELLRIALEGSVYKQLCTDKEVEKFVELVYEHVISYKL